MSVKNDMIAEAIDGTLEGDSDLHKLARTFARLEQAALCLACGGTGKVTVERTLVRDGIEMDVDVIEDCRECEQ